MAAVTSTAVPIAPSLAAIYPASALPEQAPRWAALADRFAAEFATPPVFISRAPGRVNIIGEHIDYSLYSVLPAAITSDTLVALRAVPVDNSSATAADTGTFRVALRNTASAFAPRDFVFRNGVVDIDADTPDWSNYFKAGLRGALAHLKAAGVQSPLDLKILVDGRVPVGGGLSSSAAFVTASALAVLYAHQRHTSPPSTDHASTTNIDKTALTELAIVSERAVGVNSGGMDQSASVFAQAASVLHVRFAPALRARPVRMPPTRPPTSLLIVNSCVAANKRLTAPREYNLRVVECSLAAAVLHAVVHQADAAAAGFALERDASPLGSSLHGFHRAYARAHAPGFDALDERAQLGVLAGVVETALAQREGYTLADVARLLRVTQADVEKQFLATFPVEGDRFMLRQRALHVFCEARRVLEFIALLEETDGDDGAAGAQDTLGLRLGALMNESQTSCRELYECSHPALDRICEIARRHGAYGSRLTGAGWGGCSVHLVPSDEVDGVKAALEKEYFSNLDLTDAQRESAVIITKPGSGSAIYEVETGDLSKLK
ncbi:hypothetical protein BROUX41_005599 [Berkeleyomyces rouxiae]|uniref:uncharacterized protein n=1 Tax=Berkeleyomyces rouxiae TaxID=2035830 RepID=UPI003B785EB6